MLRSLLLFAPIIVALLATVLWRVPAVRIAAVVWVVLWTGFAAGGTLLAPHRVAEEVVHRTPQSPEWQRGARDTRDVIYGVLPFITVSFLTLAIICLLPLRRTRDI